MKLLISISSWIDRVNEAIGRWVRWLTLGMVIIGSANAVFRYLGRFTGFDLSSNAYLESQWYMFSLVFLLAASYTLMHNGHVRVDVLFGKLSRKGKAWINLAGGILFLIPFCILIIWVSIPWVMNSVDVMEMSPDPGGLPRYPLKAAIPLTFVLLLLQGISETIKAAAELVSPAGPDTGHPTPDTGHRTPDTGHRTPDTGH